MAASISFYSLFPDRFMFLLVIAVTSSIIEITPSSTCNSCFKYLELSPKAFRYMNTDGVLLLYLNDRKLLFGQSTIFFEQVCFPDNGSAAETKTKYVVVPAL